MQGPDPTLNRLRRLGVRILGGPRAGSAPTVRSLLRFLAFRGTTCGVRDAGRPRDYLAVASLLKEQPQYRRREIRPLRRVHLVADVRDFAAGPEPRLMEAVRLVGGLFLTLPDCQLTLTVWGSRFPYPLQALQGEGQWPWLGRLTDALPNLTAEPAASVGALRLRLATDEAAHIVVVSGWLEPAYLRDLSVPLGGTCFLVEPAAGWLHRGRVGATDSTLALLPSAAADERDRHRWAELGRSCESRRIDLIRLAGQGPLLDRLEGALAGQGAAR